MSSMIATRDAYGETLAELGAENADIVALDADLSGSTKTGVFAKKFPERFFNMGIAEANMVGTAAGLATVGEDGGSHQSVEDIAIMRAVPNMTVIVPADGIETKGAIRAAAAYKGPVYVRLGRNKVPTIFPPDHRFEIGKGCEMRGGVDLTFVTTVLMTAPAIAAAELLAAEGISARVVHIATIKPLDQEIILTAARETGAIVTAEEHSIIGGLGGAVAELLGEEHPVPVKRVGVHDRFGTSGKAEELLKYFGLTS